MTDEDRHRLLAETEVVIEPVMQVERRTRDASVCSLAATPPVVSTIDRPCDRSMAVRT